MKNQKVADFASPTTLPEIQKLLDLWSVKIFELRDIAARILKLDIEIRRGGDENLPYFFMMRHTVELLDSIAVLVKNSSIQPCKLILRGVLENYFNLEYLSDSNSKKRAFQFIGTAQYKKLKFYKKLDKNEQSHSQFKEPFEKDKKLDGYPFSQPPKLGQAIKNIESLFEKDSYKEILKEIKRISKKNKNPNWHALFDGPRNLIDLAIEMNLGGLYETYYRFWSGPIHGTNIMENHFAPNDKGKLELYQIRLPFEAQSITHTTITLAIFIMQTYCEERVPHLKTLYLKWYETNRIFFRNLSKKNLISNTDIKKN